MTATLFKLMLFATLLATSIFAVMGWWGDMKIWFLRTIIRLIEFRVSALYYLRHGKTFNAAIIDEFHHGPAACCEKCGKFHERKSALMEYNIDTAKARFYCMECYEKDPESRANTVLAYYKGEN